MTIFNLVLLAFAAPLIAILCYGTYRTIVDPAGEENRMVPQFIRKNDR